MLCYKFEFLMIFEKLDIFQYLIEIIKMDAKYKKRYISLLIIEIKILN